MKFYIEDIVSNAYRSDPLVVNRNVAKILVKLPDFLSVKYYAVEWSNYLIGGEIGICTGRRIILDQLMKVTKRQGVKSSHVASQRRTRAEKKPDGPYSITARDKSV